MQQFIPFCKPTIGEEEINQVVESMRSGWITTGPKVKEFEEYFAADFGKKHAVAINSATGGFHVALAALGLKPGDEVITSSMTWVSVVNMIEVLGCKSVFVDVDPKTLLPDVQDIARKITPRTKVIIPVHFAGQPADMDEINALAEENNIQVIEDCAHAIETLYKGKRVGGGKNISIFSFHPIKNITTGEGGMVLCDDDELAHRMRILRFHGIEKDSWKRYNSKGSLSYDVVMPGYKYNMLDLQAGIGLAQVKKINEFNEVRTRLALRYNEAFADIEGVEPLASVEYDHKHAWHLYVVKFDLEKLGCTRDDISAMFQDKQIGVGLHFEPVHIQKYFSEKYGFEKGYLPQTEFVGERILSLPLYPLLDDEQQDYIIESVQSIISELMSK